MKLTSLARAVMALLSPGLGTQVPPMVYDGAMPDPAATAGLMVALATNAQSAAGGVNFVSASGAAQTLTALGNLVELLTSGGAVTVTLDSAYNIGLRLPQPLSVGQVFGFRIATIAATTVATPTLSDSAVTLAGTTSCVANAIREYIGTLTQVTSTSGISTTSGTTFTSLTQVGSTNNYTVVLGTNTQVPTVGQLVFLNVTTGTLPSGWYPINKVTSATSFVIAAPAASAAWTATAATVGTSTVAPATYSPLMTITGLMSVAGTVTA